MTNKCLNCGDPVNVRMFLYDSPTFCSGQCKDSYVRRQNQNQKIK